MSALSAIIQHTKSKILCFIPTDTDQAMLDPWKIWQSIPVTVHGLNHLVGQTSFLQLPAYHSTVCSFFSLSFQNSPDFRKYSWCLVSGREQKSLSARRSEKYSCPPRKRIYVSGRRGQMEGGSNAFIGGDMKELSTLPLLPKDTVVHFSFLHLKGDCMLTS